MKSVFGLLACIALGLSLLGQMVHASGKQGQAEALLSEDIDNFFRLTENVYSGSSPEKEETFAALQKRGIKTIISVDGAQPNVSAAKKYGMRTVHLPIGYDGVPTNRVAEFLQAPATLPGPIFVHCHHGKHRGPAAAAIICMGLEGWTPGQGLSWLRQAGTGSDYSGLYKSVEEFKRPSAEALARVPANFPEGLEVSALVEAMVQIEERFDHLKLVKDAGYKRSPLHPDMDPKHEALLLRELLRELLRSPDTQKRNQDYQTKLAEAEQVAQDFYAVLGVAEISREKGDAAFEKMSNSCAACHKAHRK